MLRADAHPVRPGAPGQPARVRLPTLAAVAGEVAACECRRNLAEVGVTWRFTTADAHCKLARRYPVRS